MTECCHSDILFSMRSAPLTFERALWKEGKAYVVGVDEVGCGCWAGEVVAAAVILKRDSPPPRAQDSKKLSEKQRLALTEHIKKTSFSWSIGRASLQEIDTLNIRQAAFLAMRRAIEQLSVSPDWVLCDGFNLPGITIPCTRLIHGDARSRSIAAASILAKVTRDQELKDADLLYPGYGFARHKGYGTKEHARVLETLGPTPIHRMTFEPVKTVVLRLQRKG